ncbi:hypothetical protein BLNAU_21677 [Blattamonas nauphoetae]|uniref:Uncharacterized protein n=1 Tax=Blattamonas nauphoetae TaxID=2049346 RepID=A0ABQ9WZH0_9EUKA|nr:hypothetical protein BLNAU_21677 [Blattamonas nauphoetae]
MLPSHSPPAVHKHEIHCRLLLRLSHLWVSHLFTSNDVHQNGDTVHPRLHVLQVFRLQLVENARRMCGSARPGHRDTHRRRLPLRRLGFHTRNRKPNLDADELILQDNPFRAPVSLGDRCDEELRCLERERDNNTISPICSFGSSLALNTLRFSPTLSSSTATLTAHLVHFTPKPSEEGKPGVGSCDITNIDLNDLAFHGTTMFEIDTSDRISFVLPSISRVTSDFQQGSYTTLKAQSFKLQIPPSFWLSDLKTTDLPYFNGEDIPIDEKGQVEKQLACVLAHLSFCICSESWNRSIDLDVSLLFLFEHLKGLLECRVLDMRYRTEAVTFRNPIFSSSTPPTTFNEADTTSLSRPDVTHIPQGAISISYAPLTLTACTFSSNSPSNLEWPSLRRNSKCTDGTVAMDLMNEGDAPASHHLWIWTDEGVVTKEDETQHSTLFVPTLVANESTVTLDNNLKEYSVKIVGTMMIPYGLKLEVFEQDALSPSNEGQPLRFVISSLQPSKWTETELSFVLPQSSLIDLKKKPKLRCQLVNADDQATDSFLLTGLSNENITQARVIASIVVPSVVVIIVVVLVIIVIAVLFRRRKMKEKTAEKDNQEVEDSKEGGTANEQKSNMIVARLPCSDVKRRLTELKSDHPPAADDPPQQNKPAKAISGIETD